MSDTPEYEKVKNESGFDPTKAAFEGIVDKNTPTVEVKMDTATPTPVVEPEVEVAVFEPTAFDRCDAGSCDAAALVQAVKDDFSLIFCAHHGAEKRGALEGSDWVLAFAPVPK